MPYGYSPVLAAREQATVSPHEKVALRRFLEAAELGWRAVVEDPAGAAREVRPSLRCPDSNLLMSRLFKVSLGGAAVWESQAALRASCGSACAGAQVLGTLLPHLDTHCASGAALLWTAFSGKTECCKLPRLA